MVSDGYTSFQSFLAVDDEPAVVLRETYEQKFSNDHQRRYLAYIVPFYFLTISGELISVI